MTTTKLLLLVLTLFSSTLTVDLRFSAQIIHPKAELGKALELINGNQLIVSKSNDGTHSWVSLLDDNGNFLQDKKKLNTVYTGNAQLAESKLVDGSNGYILYAKENGKEYLIEFKEGQENYVNKKEYTTNQEQVSLLRLKSGKIFFMGITKPSNDVYPTSQTNVNLKIYDPISNSDVSNGLSLPAYSKYVSCAEIKDNEVYCAYVQDENILRTVLKLQKFEVTEAGIVTKGEPYLIKYFHTQINFIKMTKINTNEVGILVQIGNNQKAKNPKGNSGEDLFFYQLKVTSDDFEVIRDDFLSDDCKFRTDPADYHADIIALDEETIYAICEVDTKIMRSFKISKDEKEIDTYDFNAEKYDEGKAFKNPTFVKFEDSLGLLCTLTDKNSVKNVVLIMMDYPNCESDDTDIKYIEECPNEKEEENNNISKYIKVFLSNPMENYEEDTKLYFRITKCDNIVLKNKGTTLELNKDYDPSTMKDIIIEENKNNGKSFVEYAVTQKISSTKIRLGRKCQIKINKPICVDPCKGGCDEGSTEDDNRCFGCKDGYYAKKKTVVKICGGDTTLYDCDKCDIACEKCFGPFINTDNLYTTNCLYEPQRGENFTYCNYIDGYYPYEHEPRTCFKTDERKKWEEKINHPVYLDKRDENDNSTWIWRDCHENCAECAGKGTNEDNQCTVCKNTLYFFCNQTEGKGIPGSCHKDCRGKGCYASKKEETEGMVKMCPCLPHCQFCQNKDFCENCWPEWLLQPGKKKCDDHCEYCLIEEYQDEPNKINGSCINCVEKYGKDFYTYGNKCYSKDKIPTWTYTEYGQNNWTYSVVEKYKNVDPKCNRLQPCKRGCAACAQDKTDICTKCEADYYKQDIRPESETFHCYNKTTCEGEEQYPHDREEKVDGVPTVENSTKICKNCKLDGLYRSAIFNGYQVPNPKYKCGPRQNRTYICNDDYNAQCECYVRCKTCQRFGNGCTMNCMSCRDAKYYDLIKYNKIEGNCIRKQHKCGIFPYYHNYEIAVDDDNCGEDCDVCLYNFICPKEFPFLKLETRECVEYCPFTQVMGGTCNTNSTYALINLLRNPFGLKNPYAPITNEIYLNQIISTDLFKYFCFAYNCDINEISMNINNYLGHGQIYNLPQSQFYFFNNMSIELSTVKLELDKLKYYLSGGKDINITKLVNYITYYNVTTKEEEDDTSHHEPTALNLTVCENILKKKYGLSAEEELMLIKADFIYENINQSEIDIKDYLYGNEFQIFSTSLGAFLPLTACKESDENTDYEVTNPFSFSTLNLQSKIGSVASNGYNAFSSDSPFYNDVCTPFTNENGNDVLLDDRRKDYFNENVNLCEQGCSFVGYNTGSKTYTCKCPIKGEVGEEREGEKITVLSMPENFKDYISRRSNIAVFKCASLVFSSKGLKKNLGAYILLVGIASFIGVVVYHFVKEKGGDNSLASLRLANPGEKSKKNKKDQKDEEVEKNKKKYDIPSKNPISKPDKVEDVVQDLKFTDDQLNFANYEEFIKHDFRSFLSMYWSFLKQKQLILFTFYTSKDNILRSSKLVLFILFVSFYMAFTALFFNDEIMRKIYIYKGNTDAAVHIPNIILSSLCSFIASIIIRFVCLGERDISKILNEKNKDNRKALAEAARRKAGIKLYILYVVSFLLILLCTYYVAAFCAVFQNSQGHYLINFLVCFIILNLWPAVTSLIITIMRKKAYDNRSPTLYKASQIVSIF